MLTMMVFYLEQWGFVGGHRDSQCLRGSWVSSDLTVKSSLVVPGFRVLSKPESVLSKFDTFKVVFKHI